MKKIVIILSVLALPVLIFWLGRFHFSEHYFIGCDISLKKINNLNVGFWKHTSGYCVDNRDFMAFDGYCEIKNDTLYLDKKPTAKVIRLVQRCFTDYELTIQSFDEQEKGTYVSH